MVTILVVMVIILLVLNWLAMLPHPPKEKRGVGGTIAHCFTCGKAWYTANAHGVGVQHARRYKHHVVVGEGKLFIYNCEKES